MLEYAKTVLEKVSFSKSLFTKELSKFLIWLTPKDTSQLYSWCIDEYGDEYNDVIRNVFKKVMIEV